MHKNERGHIMNILEKAAAGHFNKTGETKKLAVPGATNNIYEVFAIPLEFLYYNDQNGRINTAYKKYKAENEELKPEIGDSIYNKIFEQFIYESNPSALNKTLHSIKEKGQQVSGVVLPDGRVIDGNRRFTALRRQQREDEIPKNFNAVILSLDAKSKAAEKTIKTLELDLQLGREEKVSYNPIDRIFDVYNTIEVEKLMTAAEYRKASGAGNTIGINKDIRLAELILRFIKIISPGGNPIDKFYLARDLKLDGPMQEIERTLNNLHDSEKEAIIDATLVYMAISKTDSVKLEPTKAIRELKNNVLNNPEVIQYFLDAVDDKVDDIIDAFEENPIQSSNDLNLFINEDEKLHTAVEKLAKSTNRLIYKGSIDTKRTRVLVELEYVCEKLEDINPEDFNELTAEEYLDAKEVLKKLQDTFYKLKKEM